MFEFEISLEGPFKVLLGPLETVDDDIYGNDQYGHNTPNCK